MIVHGFESLKFKLGLAIIIFEPKVYPVILFDIANSRGFALSIPNESFFILCL